MDVIVLVKAQRQESTCECRKLQVKESSLKDRKTGYMGRNDRKLIWKSKLWPVLNIKGVGGVESQILETGNHF